MKKIITLIICMVLSVMTVNADICGYGHEVEIDGLRYCVSIHEGEKDWSGEEFNVSYNEGIFFIAFNKKTLSGQENINNNLILRIDIADDGFSVGPDGEHLSTDFGFAHLLEENIRIKDYDNFYKSEDIYKVYADESCINENAQGDDRYLKCEIVLEMKPKFVVNIVEDTMLEDDISINNNNTEVEENCEQIKCDAPLTFVDYLTTNNPLLITIILITVMLITISVIYVVKYRKLKKNINKQIN